MKNSVSLNFKSVSFSFSGCVFPVASCTSYLHSVQYEGFWNREWKGKNMEDSQELYVTGWLLVGLTSSQRLLWATPCGLWHSPCCKLPTSGFSENSEGWIPDIDYSTPAHSFQPFHSSCPRDIPPCSWYQELRQGTKTSSTLHNVYLNWGILTSLPCKGLRTDHFLCSAICFWFSPSMLRWHRDD